MVADSAAAVRRTARVRAAAAAAAWGSLLAQHRSRRAFWGRTRACVALTGRAGAVNMGAVSGVEKGCSSVNACHVSTHGSASHSALRTPVTGAPWRRTWMTR